MHMVIGFLIASLLKGKSKAGSTLPIIREQFEARHVMPGRIRFRVPLIETKNNVQIETLHDEISRIPDVQSIGINPYSGSILIQYDDERIEPIVICGILIRVLGLEAAFETHSESTVQKEIRMIGNAIDQSVYNSTAGALDLKSAFILLFISMGIYQIVFQKDRILPSGINLFWWAFIMAQSRK